MEKQQLGTRHAAHYGAIYWERVHEFHQALKTLTPSSREAPGLAHQCLSGPSQVDSDSHWPAEVIFKRKSKEDPTFTFSFSSNL